MTLNNAVLSQHKNPDSPHKTEIIDSLKRLLNRPSSPKTRTIILNQIAESYKTISPLQSLEYAQLALDIAEKVRFSDGKAIALNHIGEYYLDTGEYDKALEFFFKALAISKNQKNKILESISYNKIGVI